MSDVLVAVSVRHSDSCNSYSHAHVDMPGPMQKDDDL